MASNRSAPIAQTQVEDAIAAVTNALNDENPTSLAMKQMGFAVPDWQCTGTVPFSSARKWSGASFQNVGTFLIGAAEFVLGERFEPLRKGGGLRRTGAARAASSLFPEFLP